MFEVSAEPAQRDVLWTAKYLMRSGEAPSVHQIQRGRTPPSNKKSGEKHCVCGTVLSRYNSLNICFVCQRKLPARR